MIKTFLWWLRTVKTQEWRKISYYGDANEFRFWSQKVVGLGDSLPFLQRWNKVIILMPIGDQEAVFFIGFDPFNPNSRNKVSSIKRKVKDGPFAMKLGKRDCGFFVTSNDSRVNLKSTGYAGPETNFIIY